MDYLIICTKIFASMVLGTVIGYERTIAHKDAGIRTHALLCIATCSLTCMMQEMLPTETPRVIAGIVQGIGFLGAGVIFMDKQAGLKGLTSSVILWFTGAVGICIGSSKWFVVIPAFICYLIVTKLFNKWEVKVKKNNRKPKDNK